MPPATPLIQAQDLHKTYPNGQKVLEGVCLSLQPGEFVAIMGESGSGKTSLLNLLGGLDRPDSGSLKVGAWQLEQLDGSALARYRQEVGFVFQDFHLLPSLTALQNLALPLKLAGKRFDPQELLSWLERMGVAAKAQALPSQMSGGERQRVALARALASKPLLLLADEPTGNLDGQNSLKVLELLAKIHQEEGTSLVMVTHSSKAASFAQRRLVMEEGRLQ